MDEGIVTSGDLEQQPQLDPIRFEVIRHALLAVTEEMAATLRRTAYSTNIKTRADFSCCFLDSSMRVISQSFAQPIHLGNLVMLVPNAVTLFGPERLGPGDMLVSNDPFLGNNHLNDVTLIAPFFRNGGLFGYFANLAHHVDVGGSAPASIGPTREIFQEGVQIPPVRLVAGGETVDDVFRMILAQIRSKRETSGDFRAQIAANRRGAARLNELIDRIGEDSVRAYLGTVVEHTRRRTHAAIRRLPPGTYTAETELDSDGFSDRPVHLQVSVTVGDGEIEFDLTGCDPQRAAPVNATLAPTFAACAYALKALLDPDLPVNHGFYECVRVRAPGGTVVNAVPPAAVVGAGEVQIRLTDLIFLAFADALPRSVPAGSKAMQCHAGFGGIGRDGQYYCFLETLGGGYGGRVERDGPDAVQTHGQNTENSPIEETEASYPVRIVRYELIADSEGAGRQRGGLGLRRDYLFPDEGVTFSILADRERHGPWGLFGGQPGRHAGYVLNPDGNAVELGSKVTLTLKAGDVVSYRTCGGGGYGPPELREPALVLVDVREGKVTPERAREVYGVEIDLSRWVVDEQATAARRSRAASS